MDKFSKKSAKEYSDLLSHLKKRIQETQIKAVITVNNELVLLYWEIGKNILKRQSKEGWGSKVIDRLSNDLTKSFPKMKGFSSRNLKYMRRFAEEYAEIKFVQEVLAQMEISEIPSPCSRSQFVTLKPA